MQQLDSGKPKVISDADFARVMAELGLVPDAFTTINPIHVAVSGGVDSMCLAYLTRRWLGKPDPMRVLIVDHGLRGKSAKEARRVASLLTAQSIHSKVLTWTHEEILSGLEEKARKARYDLVARELQNEEAVLLLGHHLDDRIETFLMRLERNSGIKGLAGISAMSSHTSQNLRYCRPLLSFSKTQLEQTLDEAGWENVEDESNTDTRYRRNWFRRHHRGIKAVGLGKDQIEPLLQTFGQLRSCVDRFAVNFIEEHIFLDQRGWGKLSRHRLLQYPLPTQAEILLRLMNYFTRDGDERPDVKNVEKLILNGGNHGHVIFKVSGDSLWIFCCRRGSTGLNGEAFDRRFKIGDFDPDLLNINWLGEVRAQQFAAVINTRQGIEEMDRLPSFVLACLPCLERRDKPNNFELPQLDFSSDGISRPLHQDFGNLIKSSPDKSIFKVVSPA